MAAPMIEPVKQRCCNDCDPYTADGIDYGTCGECGHNAEVRDTDGDPVACDYCWGKWDEFQRDHPAAAEEIEREQEAALAAEEMGH
jgi:hypothetical protein